MSFWDSLVNLIKSIEPLFLVVIPCIFGFYLKLKNKLTTKKREIEKEENSKNNKQLADWRHEESIRIINRLKESCNYHCDLDYVHTSFLQLENGTLATSQICNMFFSCVAEDNRYSEMRKLTEYIQRVPFTRMSKWFNIINDSKEKVIYITNLKDIDDIFLTAGVKCMVSGLVHDTDGLVIGVCNFMFSEEHTEEELYEYEQKMISFISSIETIFLGFNVNLKYTKKKLNLY